MTSVSLDKHVGKSPFMIPGQDIQYQMSNMACVLSFKNFVTLPVLFVCRLFESCIHIMFKQHCLCLFQSQAEAHYKGNRHARRIKGIETSKSRPQESDKPPPGPVSSPSPTGPLPAISDTDPSKTGKSSRIM